MPDPQKQVLRKATSIGPDPNVPSREGLTGLLNWIASLAVPIYPEQEVGVLDLAAAVPALKPLKAFAKGEKALDTALDLSHAARMERAAEQGFDVSRPLYHGTTYDVAEFKPGGKRQIYLTDDPAVADIYAVQIGRHKSGPVPTAGPNVMPLYAKAKKPLVVSDLGPDGGNGWSSDNLAAVLGVDNPGTGTALYDEARKQGYDLVVIKDMSDLGPARQNQYIPLRPENVRSRFAKFDPRQAMNPNLLAGLGGGVLLSHLAQPRTPEQR